MKNIVIFNQKGGVGKTTSVVNLAGSFCKNHNKKVLCVDCDSQSNLTSYLLTNSPNIKDGTTYTLTDYFANPSLTFEDIVQHVYIPDKKKKDKLTQINIDVLPIDTRVDSVEINDIKLLSKLLKPQDKKYDYCFLDCPAHLSDVALNALCSADFVLVPAFADDDSLGGYSLLQEAINDIRLSESNVGVEIMGIVLNNLDAKLSFEKYICTMLKGGFGKFLFSASIPSSNFIPQARHFGLPICYYRPNAEIASRYDSVANEIICKAKLRKRG